MDPNILQALLLGFPKWHHDSGNPPYGDPQAGMVVQAGLRKPSPVKGGYIRV